MVWSKAVIPLALVILAGCANTPPPAPAIPSQALTVSNVAKVPLPDGRVVDVTVVAPERPRGVILFSHGGNSHPGNTPKAFARWTASGFAIVAPTHTDSLSLPKERRTSLQAALGTRIADMKLAAAYAEDAFPKLPVAMVGYSYGSLSALIGGGALERMVRGTVPGVRAVVMFSSPGPIAPLTGPPEAFSAVKVPTLLVTGTADTVPGVVADPAQHLVYFNRLPAGDHTAAIVRGADHTFLNGKAASWDAAASLVDDFLASRVLGDRKAGRRFDSAKSTATIELRRAPALAR